MCSPLRNLIYLSLIMCRDAEELKAQAFWDGAKGESRTALLSELSSEQSMYLYYVRGCLTLSRVNFTQCDDS